MYRQNDDSNWDLLLHILADTCVSSYEGLDFSKANLLYPLKLEKN